MKFWGLTEGLTLGYGRSSRNTVPLLQFCRCGARAESLGFGSSDLQEGCTNSSNITLKEKGAVLCVSALTLMFLGFALRERQQSTAQVFVPVDVQALVEKESFLLLPVTWDGIHFSPPKTHVIYVHLQLNRALQASLIS